MWVVRCRHKEGREGGRERCMCILYVQVVYCLNYTLHWLAGMMLLFTSFVARCGCIHVCIMYVCEWVIDG